MNRRSVLLGLGGVALAAAGGAGAWRRATGSLDDYAAYQAHLRAQLKPAMNDVIRYATLAANSHNTQPWRFRTGKGTIDILPDFSRRTPVVDPDDHHLHVSLGCAAENLQMAACVAGMPGELSADPVESGMRYAFSAGVARADPLGAAIPARQSTRGLYDGRSLDTGLISRLVAAAQFEGVDVAIIADAARRQQLRDLVIAANTAQMADGAFVGELRHWLRFNPRSAMASGDGLFSITTGNPILPDALGGLAFDLVYKAATENDKLMRQMDSSAAFAVFIGQVADPGHWQRVGRACQRFSLAATVAGLKFAFINQPVEVATLRADLAALAGRPGSRPDLLMRIGTGPAMPYSPRRPVRAVLDGAVVNP